MTDQLADLFTEDEHDPDDPFDEDGTLPDPAGDLERLRRALVDCLAHVEAGTVPTGNRIRAWRELAGTTYVDGLEPFERGMEGSDRAAAKWTPEEVAAVDDAIAAVARRRRAEADELADLIGEPRAVIEGTFTTADVWAELGEGFPVTKGIAGRLTSAKSAGIIESTGRTTRPPEDAPGPNNGQRLTVWRAL